MLTGKFSDYIYLARIWEEDPAPPLVQIPQGYPGSRQTLSSAAPPATERAAADYSDVLTSSLGTVSIS